MCIIYNYTIYIYIHSTIYICILITLLNTLHPLPFSPLSLFLILLLPTAQKLNFSINDFFRKSGQIHMNFTGEIFNGKLHISCSALTSMIPIDPKLPSSLFAENLLGKVTHEEA